MRRKSPITIQQWVDSLPTPMENQKQTEPSISKAKCEKTAISSQEHLESTRKFSLRGVLTRDASFQSDDASSHCSSVESVLESRKPDPEAVLIGLGFGSSIVENDVSRIPKRFLQPSKVKVAGVNIDRFLQEQQAASAAANSYFWPHLQSSLNVGNQYRNIPSKDQKSEPTS